jgi:hypothetical protein
MTGSSGYRFSNEELDWVAGHLDATVGWARNPPVVRWTLVAALGLGLVSHVVGFAIASNEVALQAGWPEDLLAELLISLGIALWTSVVIVFLLEVVPDWQSRQAARWSQAALAELQARGRALEVDVPPVDDDEIGTKLDAVLDRLTALEALVARRDGNAE